MNVQELMAVQTQALAEVADTAALTAWEKLLETSQARLNLSGLAGTGISPASSLRP